MKELYTDRESIRLDRFLRQAFEGLTQGAICAALRKKHIRVNGKIAKPDLRITPVDVIQVADHFDIKNDHVSPAPGFTPKQIKTWQRCLMQEHEHFCVLNKPAGLAMQGGTGISHCLDDILAQFIPRYHLVHRLDRETSGVCLVARSADAAVVLGRMFQDHTIRKCYHCIVQGVPGQLEGVVRTPIDDQEALTRYKVLAHHDKFAWVACYPHTGRKHQVRRHMLELNTPIVGDARYNYRTKNEPLQLHAFSLALPSLWGGDPFMVEVPHPSHMKERLLKESWAV